MNLLVRGSAIVPEKRTLKPPLIAVREVDKVYRSGAETVRALDRVSFEIQEGELVAIMGPSGSGKSTMMNLLGALDVPTAGSILLNGNDVGTLSRDALADLQESDHRLCFPAIQSSAPHHGAAAGDAAAVLCAAAAR